MIWTQEKIDAIFEQVAKKAATDNDFRQLALKSPREAIAKVSVEPIPADFKVRFVENAGAHMTFVLPDPIRAGNELSDAELEAVAGGKCGMSCGVTEHN